MRSAAACRRDCALPYSRRLRAKAFGLRHMARAVGKDGYDRFYLTRDGVGFWVRPYRSASAIAGRRVAAGETGLHECDNPVCVKCMADTDVRQHVVSGSQDNME